MTPSSPVRPRAVTRRAGPYAARRRDSAPLLLASGLSAESVTELLAPFGFEDIKRADDNIQAMAGEPRSRERLAKILDDLLAAVARSADPDLALNYWERFLQAGVNRIQLFDYLIMAPRILHLLCAIFGNSPAMAQTLIRDPVLIYWLVAEPELPRRQSPLYLGREVRAAPANAAAGGLKREALRRFRGGGMIRPGGRGLLRVAA